MQRLVAPAPLRGPLVEGQLVPHQARVETGWRERVNPDSPQAVDQWPTASRLQAVLSAAAAAIFRIRLTAQPP